MDHPFNLGAGLKALAGRQRLLISPHDDPDPDALAAAWGMGELLIHELGIEAVIAFEGIIGRAENRAMVRELGIKLRRLETLDLETFDGVLLVDTQPAARNHSAPRSLPMLGCVDHHPLLEDGAEYPWFDVRPAEGTTSAIVLSYLLTRGIAIDAQLATAILYALKTDTLDFSRGATETDLAAYAHVFPRADHEALGAIINPRLDPPYFELLHRALDMACVHGPAVVIFLSALPYPDLVAEMADLFVRRRGIEWCICGGTYRGALRFSLRTESEEANAGEIVQGLVAAFGGAAGGHGTTAAGRIPIEERDNDVAAQIWSHLVDAFRRAVGIEMEGEPLLAPEDCQISES
ncbi:MAG: phosphoesterase [Anaerolineae bacterium]|jgi:nanoRNase/pAp phosphatase (c-di-AMP/oligoRNAs hydrolase)